MFKARSEYAEDSKIITNEFEAKLTSNVTVLFKSKMGALLPVFFNHYENYT